MKRHSNRRDDDEDDDDTTKKGRGRADDDDDDDDDADDDDDKPTRKAKSKGRGRDDDDEEGVSLELEDAVDSGLFDAGRAQVVESIFAEYNYGGHSKGVPVWLIVFERDGEKYEQPYGIGKGWKIINKGRGIKGNNKGLPKSCNAIQFLLAPLRKAGMEPGVFKNDPTVLEGLDCIVDRVEQPKRPGLNQSEKDRSILVITKIKSAPWDTDGKSGGGKKKPKDDDEDEADEKPTRKSKPAAGDDEDDDQPKAKTKAKAKSRDADEDDDADLDEEAVEGLIEVLDTNKGKVSVDDIEDLALVVLKGNKQAKAIAARMAEDDLLEQEKGWTFNAKKKLVTLG